MTMVPRPRKPIHDVLTIARPPEPRARPPLPRMNHNSYCNNNDSYHEESSNEDEQEDTLMTSEDDESEDDQTTLNSSQFSRTEDNNHNQNSSFMNATCIICNNKFLISIFILLIGLIVASNSRVLSAEKNLDQNKDQKIDAALEKLRNKLNKLEKVFTNQKSDLWDEIYSGVEEALRSEKPSIFILFANNSKTIDCLSEALGKVTSIALSSELYLKLDVSTIGKSLGGAIESLKEIIPQKRAVIIKDFLEIDINVLPVLHNLCDRENPLVGKAVYFLTLTTNTNSLKNGNEVLFMENYLRNSLQGKIHDDKIMPLITRITEGPIIHVQQEMTNC